jgi:hypothetical protein
MFAHIENQQILWEIIQKSPFFIEFSPHNRETWFREVVSQFYRENPVKPRNSRELLSANKAALQYMTQDLKRRIGYNPAVQSALEPTLSPLRIEEEKKAKSEREKELYANFQAQYHSLLQTPKPVDLRLPEKSEEKITNMEELLQQQIKQREMDLAKFSVANGSSVANGPAKIKIIGEEEDISREIATIISQASTNNEKTVSFSQSVEEICL